MMRVEIAGTFVVEYDPRYSGDVVRMMFTPSGLDPQAIVVDVDDDQGAEEELEGLANVEDVDGPFWQAMRRALTRTLATTQDAPERRHVVPIEWSE